MIARPPVLPSYTFTETFCCKPKIETKFYLHVQYHPETKDIMEIMFDIGKCGTCEGIIFNLLAQALSYALRSDPKLIDKIIVSFNDVVCPAYVPGHPKSCADWISLKLKEVRQLVKEEGVE